MFDKRTFNYIAASVIVLIAVFSGCVSQTPAPTPAPTATPASTPTQIAPLPTAITPNQVVTPPAAPAIPPAIKVTSYPTSVNGGTNITIRWEVSGGAQGEISSTQVLWGYKSGGANISDYPRGSKIQTGKTPEGFSAGIIVPAGGTFYFRAYAVVDGMNVYSPENQITIIAPMGEGGY